MPNGLCRSLFDLCLDLSGRRGVIDDDAEPFALDEEASCLTLAIGVEGNRLNREIADVAADDYPNNAEQASRNLFRVLGVLLHEP